ncbi:MAG: tRNA pseudouridine(38-40) synthase TruA [Bacteroidales bacterium]
MDFQRYFLRLAYDGTRFHGWQRQPNAITVQQTLEEAMSLVLRQNVVLTGAGRTDTGVHADEFFAHFDLNYTTGKAERDKTIFRLNAYLGSDIALYDLIPVIPSAHARFSALSRMYRYRIARLKDPFRKDYVHLEHGKINHELMNQGAALIMGYDDFTSFSKVDTDTMTNNCKITHAEWVVEGSELVFTITADRFLRNMVRAIVGTLLALGKGKISLEELGEIVESKNRSNAGDSAPAKGLTLYKILYPPYIYAI